MMPVMSALGQVYQFPLARNVPLNPAPQAMKRVPRYFSEIQTLDPGGVSSLRSLAGSIVSKANALIEYTDENRDDARLSGVETIAIELSAILEGGKLQRVQDALEEAQVTGASPSISIDGFSKLRRAEHLTIEADRSIDRHIDSPARGSQAPAPYMGQASSPAAQGASLPLILFGVIGAGAILAAVVFVMFKKK